MNAELWRRVVELYDRAMARPAEARAAFVREQAAQDPELLREVEDLLAADPVATEGRLHLANTGEPAPRQFGDYRLLHELGEGGMGTVYLAERPDGSQVALKVLSSLAGIEDRAVRRFKREIAALARLRHENIVALVDHGQQDGRWFLVMDYVAGRSLGSLLRRAREGIFDQVLDLRSPRQCALCIATVLDALAHAHERGLLHRDIKPDNVLITDDGQPMLVDFGIAHDLDGTAATTVPGPHGTLHYMSPEQAMARRAGLDHRSDLFSVATVLYELLTLRRPFDGSDDQAVLESILLDDPRPIEQVNTQVPRGIAAVCVHALHKHPAHRFAGAAEFAAALRSAAAGVVPRLRGEPLLARITRHARRRPRAAGIVATLAIATLAASTFAASRAYAGPASSVLQLSGFAPGSHVELVQMDDDPGGAPIRTPVGSVQGATEQREIPTGELRIVVGEPACEYYRRVALGTVVAIAPPGNPSPRVDMLAFAGGRIELRSPWPGNPSVRIDVEPFRLARHLVTNREYLEFLTITGATTELQNARWNRTAALAVRPDWDDLPATSFAWGRARDYAEWRGLRLPTEAELAFALTVTATAAGVDPARLGPEELARRFVVGRTNGIVDHATYLLHVRPVGEDQAPLAHAIGNVWQFTETPLRQFEADHWTVKPTAYLALGGSFARPAASVARDWLSPTYVPPDLPQPDVGIRCACSDRP